MIKEVTAGEYSSKQAQAHRKTNRNKPVASAYHD